MGTENTSVSVVCASVSVTPQAGSASDFLFSIGLDITSMFQTLVAVPLSSTRMVPFFLGLLNWNFIQTLNFIFHITVTQGHCIFISFSSRPSFLSLALVLKTSSGLQCLPQERTVQLKQCTAYLGSYHSPQISLGFLVSSTTDDCAVSPCADLTYEHTIPLAWNTRPLPFPPEASSSPHT